MSGNFQECLDPDKAAGVDCPMYVEIAAGLEQSKQTLRLAEGLPARAGNAATALLIKRQIFFYLSEDFTNIHTPPGCFMGKSRAYINTGSTCGAFVLIPQHTFIAQLQGVFGTMVNTFTTAYTFLTKKENFGVKVYPLRIMTPPAGKRATLEEDRRSDIRAIMQGIAFDGKYVC